MTNHERAFFAKILSSLFCPPDQGMVEQLSQGHLQALFRSGVQSWAGENWILKDLKEEYYRLFSDTGEERISLVESFYKPWTQDPHCSLPFAKEKGFLMGDSAIHLSALLQHCGLEVEDPFKEMPDHIVIELEFLSYLYREAGDEEVKRFIKDHLDWIPSLKESVERAQAHPFYMSSIEILDLFINQEKRRLEKENDGTKDIHPDVV